MWSLCDCYRFLLQIAIVLTTPGIGSSLGGLSANRKLSRNASAVSDVPHSKKAARFGDVVRGASDTAV
jgi:hypothetical protein